jgi:hypothetical protein
MAYAMHVVLQNYVPEFVGCWDFCCSHWDVPKFPMCASTCSKFFMCSSTSYYSNSQCVPRHVPNSISLYPISLALRSTLVTYRMRPNQGDYPTSILKLSKTLITFCFFVMANQ